MSGVRKWVAGLPLPLRILVRLGSASVALLGLVEMLQGAPQAANWAADLGVSHSRLLGQVAAAVLTVGFGLLTVGPTRLEEWKQQLTGPTLVFPDLHLRWEMGGGRMPYLPADDPRHGSYPV